MHINPDDEDELAVTLDGLVLLREQINRLYDPQDRDRYIAAINRIADRLGCVLPE